MAAGGWQYREQDAHPEIRLDRVSAIQRRAEYARLRAEGHSVLGAGAILGLDEHTRAAYEKRRLRSARMYEAMSKRHADLGEKEAG